ncbi:DUF4917 family protein [Mycobacteroides abscessus]|uniref:DUF4917 family protein n=1 Tax=Mycobacteroides abscessus TaxID=36809 RepID=UPI0013F5C2A5|nr:DUF4917 family protein [Mycobacteroides abscessus]
MAAHVYHSQTPALLLGNGFSQAFDGKFGYETLRKEATLGSLSNNVTKDGLFDHAGTNDFETVIRTLEDAAQLHDLYNPDGALSADLRADAEVVKKGLVDALAAIHPSSAEEVEHPKYVAARKFLTHFSALFTLNYDLLLYWVRNRQLSLSQACRIPSNDGFTDYGNREQPLTWVYPGRSSQEVFYLHGAMHLYADGSEIRKLRYAYGAGGKLIEQVQANLTRGRYPLVVTEGTHQNKRARIAVSPYLSHCYNRLKEQDGVLFVHGVSLSENDQHILDAIRDSNVSAIFVGLFGRESSYRDVKYRAEGVAVQRRERGGSELAVEFYQSESAQVCG